MCYKGSGIFDPTEINIEKVEALNVDGIFKDNDLDIYNKLKLKTKYQKFESVLKL